MARRKIFGLIGAAMDRNAKCRVMFLARCIARQRVPGRQRGMVTRAALEVLQAMLWTFHNAKSGACYPSYETIAEAAHCHRDTVCEAIKALESAGVLTWVNRIKRVKDRVPDLLGPNGWRWRVLRTSNAYTFTDPKPSADPPKSSRSDSTTGTQTQDSNPDLLTALDRLQRGIRQGPRRGAERVRLQLGDNRKK
jgi:hypothetical protein